MDLEKLRAIEKEIVDAKAIAKKSKKPKPPVSNYLLSFDIETTSWNETDATMYDWTLGGAHYEALHECRNNADLDACVTCVFGRTWAEFDVALEELNTTAEAINNRIYILVYNLAYEWSFMQKNIDFVVNHFNPEFPTVIEGNHNIMSLLAGNIVFIDAARVFGLGSLKQNAGKYGFEKLEYEYELKRHSETELTADEIKYNENDVLITLGAWSKYMYQHGYTKIDGAPFTSTSIIKDNLKKNKSVNTTIDYREHWRYGKNKDKKYMEREAVGVYTEAVSIASQVLKKEPIEEIAAALEQAFSGGFSHCNPFAQGNIYYNVASVDLVSAYPSAMQMSWYPRTIFKLQKPNEKLEKMMQQLPDTPEKAMQLTRQTLPCFGICQVVLTDISVKVLKQKFTMPLISRHKLLSVSNDALFDNGKLVECEQCELWCSTIDLMTWRFCYDYTIKECKTIYGGYDIQQLPQYWLNAVEYTYKAKKVLKKTIKAYTTNQNWQEIYSQLPDIGETEIKHVESMDTQEAIYYLNMVLLQRKSELNGLYGIMVMHIMRDSYTYNSDKDIIKGESTIRKTKDGTCYLWGVIVTSIVRLWEVCISHYVSDKGFRPLYWDTDSVKIATDGVPYNIKEIVSEFNSMAGILNDNLPELGTYDFEGMYNAFKSLGSKRYVVCEPDKDNQLEWQATIAGLPKKVFSNFLTQEFRKLNKIFPEKEAMYYTSEYFRPEVYIDESATSKLIPKYLAKPELTTLQVTDYKGKTITEIFYTGARLSGIRFAILSTDSAENRRYIIFCNKCQGREQNELIPITIFYKNGTYQYVEGSIETDKLYGYIQQKDMRLY